MYKNLMENVLVLDLELNQPSRTIIQLGYVIGNVNTGDIMESVSRFIQVDEDVSERIQKLTGISQNDVDGGVTLADAYDEMLTLHGRYSCFINPVTWGGDDAGLLREQLPKGAQWVFGRRWIDVKTIFIGYQVANKRPFLGGLSRSMRRLGLTFDGRTHDAVHDAVNTFRVLIKLLEMMRR